MLRLDYIPNVVEWIHSSGDAMQILAVSDKESPKIYIYDGRAVDQCLHVLEKIHNNPATLIKYNSRYDVAISTDKKGMLGRYLYNKLNKYFSCLNKYSRD